MLALACFSRAEINVEKRDLRHKNFDWFFQDLIWESSDSDATPKIEVETVEVKDYEADATLTEEVDRAYSILEPLLKTDLTIIPKKYSPLSSRGVREQRSTMATYLCSAIKQALNMDRTKRNNMVNCDAVLIKGEEELHHYWVILYDQAIVRTN